ncbi:hypothetical protein SLS53_008899 [Cytospora paraplurivora]|uniref:Helicase C-terminal domain-containing protein n=1 Tax=Cytospora paraplurivora TaxID=2898453 RepID=A0AAN9YBN8_9PEZI
MTATEQFQQRYIPVGCIVYPLVDRKNVIHPFNALSMRQWIRLDSIVSRDDENTGITRVFILPDDSENGAINRTDPALRKQKQVLLSSLDYSTATWNGLTKHGRPLAFPTLSHRAKVAQSVLASPDAGKDVSLLEMFNSIPSPRPNIHSIKGHFDKKIMSELLSSTVEGLTTEMYPYQCRSAAMMFRKEVQPGQVLDPRLVEVIDQGGGTWYYESVEGGAYREARYYDGIRGGILAEEMGSGKTLICLALIAATSHQPAAVPSLYQGSNITIRPKIGSLMDMAAAVATNNAAPWKRYIEPSNVYCIRALERNPGWYYLPPPEAKRPSRRPIYSPGPSKIYMSHSTLIVVPPNLLKQWEQEISKHTKGLRTLVLNKDRPMPPPTEMLLYDIILCSVVFLGGLWATQRWPEAGGSYIVPSPLGQIHFKRCIVDEGHKLGNVKHSSARTLILRLLDGLHITSRWVVTGTPSKGLFGLDETIQPTKLAAQPSPEHESNDLERIGAIARWYLKARPWSNTIWDHGDTIADWKVYVMQPKHNPKSKGRWDCLRSTLNSLIIRHRLSEISHMLPDVESRVVKLEGSYQDKLSMNLFSMMIIFNAVQSQRTDQDFFFHPRNRKSLLQLVHNLRQATFFGGSFYSSNDIQKSVDTAEEFVRERKIAVADADVDLLRAALNFGKVVICNEVKRAANAFHEMPIYIRDFPGGTTAAWSMVSGRENGTLMCTNWKLVLAAQKILHPFLDSAEDLNTYLNSGAFQVMGGVERDAAIREVEPKQSAEAKTTLAGNTKLGEDHVSPRKRHSVFIRDAEKAIPTPPETPAREPEIAAPLANTQLVSTCSAKLSYLVDAIVSHQKEEQIIVFYENDNVAWYLAGILEMLHIHHLIYAQGISTQRRAQYISTFNNSSKFRVMLMDISQAAFGLDMRSASRIYFINPVLNPQVEAQAIGRAKRISQQRKVTVETLVLKDSLEEVITERKQNMTQAEHLNCKTILDDKPIYEWIRNPKIIPLPPDVDVDDGPGQMAPLAVPQYVFGREVGRGIAHPDEDILLEDPSHTIASAAETKEKRQAEETPLHDQPGPETPPARQGSSCGSRPAKRARFADTD